jgi:hypothetical protein
MNQPIFITGVERSGSTLIAKIMDLCQVHVGQVSTMYENIGIDLLMKDYLFGNKHGKLFTETKSLKIPIKWNEMIMHTLQADGYKDGPWLCKSSKMTQMWPVWHYAFPNARWIIVRRRTGDIIQSCMKTGYMKLFKDPVNLKEIKVTTEEEGWRWLVKQYEKKFVEMIEAGVNCKQVWPERMVYGDYQQVYETLEWLGLKWNSKIVETIDPMLIKSRRKEQWHI